MPVEEQNEEGQVKEGREGEQREGEQSPQEQKGSAPHPEALLHCAVDLCAAFLGEQIESLDLGGGTSGRPGFNEVLAASPFVGAAMGGPVQAKL
jgi:hypothetical protein